MITFKQFLQETENKESKPKILLEGTHLAIYEALIPLFLIEENGNGGGEGGGESGESAEVPVVTPAPTPPPSIGYGGWGPGPFRRSGGMSAHHWFKETVRTLKNLAVASSIKKRLKKLGVKGAGVDRVNASVKNAAKAAKELLTNPHATAYKIPVWRIGSPSKTAINVWNEAFDHAFRAELAKLVLTED